MGVPVPRFPFYGLWVRGTLGARRRAGLTVVAVLAGGVCVGEEGGECERLVNRGPSAAAGGGHELSKKKVNVLRHTWARMLLPCFYAPPWGLRLDIFKTDFLAW